MAATVAAAAVAATLGNVSAENKTFITTHLPDDITDFVEHQNSATSIICFSVSLVCIVCHSLLVPWFASLRKLYGIELLVTLTMMATFYTLMLVGAMVKFAKFAFACEVMGMITHITMLIIPSSILLATVLLWSRIRIGKLVHVVTWRMNGGYLLLILLLPVLCFSGSVIIYYLFPTQSWWNPRYAGGQCPVGCIENHAIVVFLPSVLMYGGQFLFLLFITRLRFSRLSTVGQAEAAGQPDNEARLLMCWKLGISNFVISLCTFGANSLCSPMMWHLFTILSTMQCIYIAINLSFSRPFLMVFFRQGESKIHKKVVNSIAFKNKNLPLPHDATQNTLI